MPIRVHMSREPEPEQRAKLVEALTPIAQVTFGPETDPQTEILVEGQLTEAHLSNAPSVEHVIIPFAGLQAGTRAVLRTHPTIRAHNLHHNAAMTAEMAIALLFACSRRIVSLHNAFSHDSWEPRWFSRDAAYLCGKRAVILGYGEIGRRVGRVCEALGMEVVGVRSKRIGASRGIEDLHDLLPTADCLIVTLPGTDATSGLIGESEIALLPNHSIIVNVGRGSVICERALYEALRDEKIDSAGLDVWWNYPKAQGEKTPPSEYPFGKLGNVVMTPHVGGATRDAECERIKELARVIREIASGNSTANLVDLEKGY